MLWFGALIALCYIPGTTDAYIATQWPVLGVALFVSLLWRRSPVTAFHWLGALFLAYAAMHMFFTPVPYAGVWGLWLVLIMGLSLWFGTTLKRDTQDDVKELYKGLAIGGVASTAFAALQYFGLEWPPTTSGHFAGLYVNSIQQGTVLALIFVALMTEGLWRWALPLLPGIMMAGSRGAWVALAIGLLGLGIRRAWLFGFAAAGLAVYLFALPLAPSDQQRMLIWDVAWRNLTWLGWGPGSFYTMMIPQPSGAWLFPEHAHNDALQLIFEYGAGGALPLIVFAFALSRTDAREWPIVLAFATASCYSPVLWMPVASFLALAAVGRVLRTYALAVSDGDRSRQHVVSRRHSDARTGREAVPVAPYHPAEG